MKFTIYSRRRNQFVGALILVMSLSSCATYNTNSKKNVEQRYAEAPDSEYYKRYFEEQAVNAEIFTDINSYEYESELDLKSDFKNVAWGNDNSEIVINYIGRPFFNFGPFGLGRFGGIGFSGIDFGFPYLGSPFLGGYDLSGYTRYGFYNSGLRYTNLYRNTIGRYSSFNRRVFGFGRGYNFYGNADGAFSNNFYAARYFNISAPVNLEKIRNISSRRISSNVRANTSSRNNNTRFSRNSRNNNNSNRFTANNNRFNNNRNSNNSRFNNNGRFNNNSNIGFGRRNNTNTSRFGNNNSRYSNNSSAGFRNSSGSSSRSNYGNSSSRGSSSNNSSRSRGSSSTSRVSRGGN